MNAGLTKRKVIIDLYMPEEQKAATFLQDYPLGLVGGLLAGRTQLKGLPEFEVREFRMPNPDTADFKKKFRDLIGNSLANSSLIVSGNSPYSRKLLEFQANLIRGLKPDNSQKTATIPAHAVVGFELRFPAKAEFTSFAFRLFPSYRHELIRFLAAIRREKPTTVINFIHEDAGSINFDALLKQQSLFSNKEIHWKTVKIEGVKYPAAKEKAEHGLIVAIFSSYEGDFEACRKWLTQNYPQNRVIWLFSLHMAKPFLSASAPFNNGSDFSDTFELVLPRGNATRKGADEIGRKSILDSMAAEKSGVTFSGDITAGPYQDCTIDWIGKYAYDLGQLICLATWQKEQQDSSPGRIVLAKSDLLAVQPFHGISGAIRLDDRGELVSGAVMLRSERDGIKQRQEALLELPQTAGVVNNLTSKDFESSQTNLIKRKIKRFIKSDLKLTEHCCFLDVTYYDPSDIFQRYSVCAGPVDNLQAYLDVVKEYQGDGKDARRYKIGNHPVFRAGLPILAWEGDADQKIVKEKTSKLPVWRYPQNEDELGQLKDFLLGGLSEDWVLTVNQPHRWNVSQPADSTATDKKGNGKLATTITHAVEPAKGERIELISSDKKGVPNFDQTVEDFLHLLEPKSQTLRTLAGHPLRQLVLVPLTLYRTEPELLTHPVAYLVIGIGWDDEQRDKLERWLLRTISMLRAFLLATFTTNGLSRVLREENYHYFYNQLPLELRSLEATLSDEQKVATAPTRLSMLFTLTRYRATYSQFDRKSAYDIHGLPEQFLIEGNPEDDLNSIYTALVEPFVWQRLGFYRAANFDRDKFLRLQAQHGTFDFKSKFSLPILKVTRPPGAFKLQGDVGHLFVCLVLAMRQAAFHGFLYAFGKHRSSSPQNSGNVKLEFIPKGEFISQVKIINSGKATRGGAAYWETVLESKVAEPTHDLSYPKHSSQKSFAAEIRLFIRDSFQWRIKQYKDGNFCRPASKSHAQK